MKTFISSSPAQTRKIAATLADNPHANRIICLYGDLGTGKTVFAKGFAAELGVKESEIKSPTYTFVRRYSIGKKHLYHFDFYRIEAPDDLIAHDLEEIFGEKNAYIIIEWPERMNNALSVKHTRVELEYINEKKRKITISGHEPD
ncbi:tRNA (adenosine(37)-N6)-threonylcarbamoyltransferase complex ATPase subunit type 1 TsaE [Patescibacteria group bacterium]|nr:tRNA (adenosine(37)-N6)-threonylcarbamoyltransferase complex ATPase subunit type 1 TsaE [Patescibacteria group bacterium]